MLKLNRCFVSDGCQIGKAFQGLFLSGLYDQLLKYGKGMINLQNTFVFILSVFTFFACEKNEPETGSLQLMEAFVGDTQLNLAGGVIEGLPVDRSITLNFSAALDKASAEGAILLRDDQQLVNTNISFSSEDKTVILFPVGPLQHNTVYTLAMTSQLKGASGETFMGREIPFKTQQGTLEMVSVQIAGKEVDSPGRMIDVPLLPSIEITFSSPLDKTSFQNNVILSGPDQAEVAVDFSNEDKTVLLVASSALTQLSQYTLELTDAIQGRQGEPFEGFTTSFYTAADSIPKFPVIDDEALLTKVQQQTFKYFWDFAHPHSGLARERNTSGDLVTIGGSGFGIMAILIGIERGFIARQEGIERLSKIVNFLAAADRFHGVWPHWMDGNTGKVIPFSPKDNGGDLVETALLVQGLLTVRAYLNPTIPEELSLAESITQLWEAVEWSWYTRGGENVLYWHWSPDYGWEMNLPVQGYNEGLIVYVLAASSPTYPIDKAVYTEGWAKNGQIINGKTFYGYQLPLGYDYGGPLFFAHYSFLGLDPRNLQDAYADYWQQNEHHTRINQAYCINNPQQYAGYSENNWGLTASDNHMGYSAHSPTQDLGVITPTAALSSFPYTPEASQSALHFFYYTLGDRLWGEYGFYDAFNVTENWYADSYLAIDQGPIIIMIENHRTALLWDLFMSVPEVWQGLEKLGFTSFNKTQ